MHISASFPSSKVPTLSSIPNIFAGLMVIAFRASSSFNPFFTAKAADIGKNSIGTTG